jgi:alkylated DNA repair dioxygenase AlkB
MTPEDFYKLGLSLVPDFITPEEEQALLAGIAQTAQHAKPVMGSAATKARYRNSIQRFGCNKLYPGNHISKEIPEYFNPVIAKLVAGKFLRQPPDAITVNEYLTGQKIQPHIDSPEAGPVITVLSLLSDATMLFELGERQFTVELPVRCITQMRGIIRSDWLHSILPVQSRRYSIVFRGVAG